MGYFFLSILTTVFFETLRVPISNIYIEISKICGEKLLLKLKEVISPKLKYSTNHTSRFIQDSDPTICMLIGLSKEKRAKKDYPWTNILYSHIYGLLTVKFISCLMQCSCVEFNLTLTKNAKNNCTWRL